MAAGGCRPSSAAQKASAVATIAERGMVDAADLHGVGMDVDELLARRRNVEQRVGLRRHLRHAAADQEDEIGRFDAGLQLRIGSDADFAGKVGMVAVEQRLRGEKRPRPAGRSVRRSAANVARPRSRPADAAEDRDRPLRRRRASSAVRPFASGPARSATGSTARGVARHRRVSVSTSSGSAITTGPGRPCIAT